MIILILGGQGNLGTQLTKSLTGNYEVVSLDREDLDFLDFKVLISKVREIAPNIIINAAAYNAVDQCENKEEYELAMKLNAYFPGLLADIAVEQKAVLIHYSTDYVFSGTEDKTFFTEEDTPNPVNKYGESKFQGEQEILRRVESGLKYYLIRTSKLFGPRGSSPQAKPSFFDIMLDLVQNKKELTVVNEELSCFTYTPDLSLATRQLWELEKPYGVYHLVNQGPVTWYDAVKELFRLKKITAPIRAVRSENLLRAARRPKFSILKNTKVKKMRSWEEALQEYLRK
ncbi:dTDP-4-dehydrorhamnose reductase [Candidatus Falkowbacteria bacterium]|uniref:dTDP-4-dehydrorhamnose reductase n=1 Tax=Candidatus Falkowbacteria bacterium CG10_big_fil_rev_8_21_14_0_10_37_18 TaxID=1974562 RepID=A0A2H0V996_9BACT|nr:dTDP-4-dehydrorhamnose reductase [Candidatus Falkowbacteria bacterium]NCQ12669.1 dTDP-4-dehydrorhamnose reductase [Candidatus Falkowbacteria bacterium]OIO06233.1 MAG: dTDP-4-dehydrorhamnose reductase [Candidatus Falkowbacteria bacterium CG1_02_37_21]PIR95641.1 MAG: dTDP-4-dehydrorhamnose reductase [Candidatus Falkowbacteria bacterium CG10_big_fil_rev_8_21_14_0_10_37_18]